MTWVPHRHFFRHSAGITIRPRLSIFLMTKRNGIYPSIPSVM